ncbi:superoxide dismutase copper/zinc binding protein [Cellulophaga algicola DSM 14237]|uniref:Superoxide dismutase [Cu-Zn] n=1 Tax=Cellulophaga algicola (strain DSM 14237 / IC166 / ACAM 630) TaxID=688270 RepID=E6X7U0_CELAD|nr:superoxide dismutase family protein [Cellulophaga algicola]ADV47533.1 superoxide dismutase copper/zinc binding protein [Cellulophaga algicola DSM 14237]
MKKLIFALTIAVISISYSCKETKKEVEETSDEIENSANEMTDDMEDTMDEKTMTISLEPKSDSKVKGEVTFTEKDGEVMMVATLAGLSEGEHAIHIHETADCSSADGKSAGGHWNPTFQQHGKWGDEAGYHRGDIGNFMADADGNAKVEFSTDEWCIDCDDDTKNIIGKGVIVHQGVDDFTSQPSGDAGARVSCAGIIQ